MAENLPTKEGVTTWLSNQSRSLLSKENLKQTNKHPPPPNPLTNKNQNKPGKPKQQQ